MRCDICKEPAVETLEFEGGNNAELSMTMAVCEACLAEYEKDEYAFQDKYADKINDGCYEELSFDVIRAQVKDSFSRWIVLIDQG